jgi:acetoin:2,6-dichlorophenolindophenol oxidoreductase subunit alpha
MVQNDAGYGSFNVVSFGCLPDVAGSKKPLQRFDKGALIIPVIPSSYSDSDESGAKVDREIYLRAYRWMLLGRTLDDKLANLYRAGIINGGVYLGRGQEALSVAIGLSLRRGDVFAPLIRDTAGRLAFGESLLDALRTYLGSPLGPMRGRDGNVHRGRLQDGVLPMLSHLGCMISAVNGVLMARRFKGVSGTVGATSLGDGGTSTGAFHEGLNQAAVERLPLVLVVANNQYAYSTPTERQFACQDLVDKAVGYGVAGYRVNGTNLDACLQAVGTAVARARQGEGPQFVVADLLRLCGHGEHDDANYMDPALKQKAMGGDCLRLAEQGLLERGWATKPDLSTLREEVRSEVDAVVALVQREAGPDPYREDWCAISTPHLREFYHAPPA